jgi:hypothetical protein
MRRTTTLFSNLLIVTLMASAGTAFGQVKIGTNPTTIGANSNLEVEAVNNKKVIVHKNDGTVVIENTPSGAETDSIMTIDVTGNVRRVDRKRMLGTLGSAQMTVGAGQSLQPQVDTKVDYTNITFDDEGGVDLTANEFTITRDGFYTIYADIRVQIPLDGALGATGSFTANLVKKDAGSVGFFDGALKNRGDVGPGSITSLIQGSVGDKFYLVVRPCSGCTVGNAGYQVFSSNFTVIRNR